jgi:gamma-glutamyltranspeptidase
MEGMEINFNEDGTHKLSLYTGTEGSKIITEVLKEINNTPELKKRMEEIIDKKRIEWNDRESSRRLVG